MLYLNNTAIAVEDSFSMRIEAVNPACYFDKIPGNAGLGIDIPVNPRTRALFGNPERFEKQTTVSDRKFPGFSVRVKGMLLESGTFIINTANAQRYSGWLQPGVGEMGEEMQNKFINQLGWKTGVDFEDKTNYSPVTDEYCKVKIVNEHFWEGKGAHGNVMEPYLNEDKQVFVFERYANYLSRVLGYRTKNLINEIPPERIDNEALVVSPFLFFTYFLEELLRMNRFYIRSHPFDSIPGINTLAIYNNYNIFEPEPRGLKNTVPRDEGGSYEQEFTTYQRRRSEYLPVTKEVINTTDWILHPFNYADLIPKESLKDTLLSIQNYLNICFDFRPDRTVNIVDRDAVLKEEAFDLSPWLVSDWMKGEQKQVSLKFVAKYDENDANFGDEFHDLSDRWQDFKYPVDSYEDLEWITAASRRGSGEGDRTLGQLRYVRLENKIYEYKWTAFSKEDVNGTEEQINVLGWEFVSSGPQYYVYRNGDEIEEVNTGISTLQLENGILTARQQGNVNAMRSLWADFSFRLFYYLGSDTGSTENPDSMTSCNWEGENGIFEKRWKTWARFWANRLPVEADFNLPLNVLNYVLNNKTKKYRTGSGEFIIDTIKVDIGIDRIGKTHITGYKV